MVPHIWIQATFAPVLILSGLEDLSQVSFYLGIVFIFVAAYSIYKGLCAFTYQVYSDFIMLALIPAILPVVLSVYITFF